ncbi:uncharacterized protein DS421_16g531420 [Arachis hypogaea]|nr:uncharacterized protein DS421_16g531420 [Arachis hypogaea]
MTRAEAGLTTVAPSRSGDRGTSPETRIEQPRADDENRARRKVTLSDDSTLPTRRRVRQ